MRITKFSALIATGVLVHLAGWASWFYFAWLNRLADIHRHPDAYHWAAQPHGFGTGWLMLLGCLLVLTAFVNQKELS